MEYTFIFKDSEINKFFNEFYNLSNFISIDEMKNIIISKIEDLNSNNNYNEFCIFENKDKSAKLIGIFYKNDKNIFIYPELFGKKNTACTTNIGKIENNKNNNTFKFEICFSKTIYVDIEAESEKEALEKMRNKFNNIHEQKWINEDIFKEEELNIESADDDSYSMLLEN